MISVYKQGNRDGCDTYRRRPGGLEINSEPHMHLASVGFSHYSDPNYFDKNRVCRGYPHRIERKTLPSGAGIG